MDVSLWSFETWKKTIFQFDIDSYGIAYNNTIVVYSFLHTNQEERVSAIYGMLLSEIKWFWELRLIVQYLCYRYDGRGHISDLRPFDAEFVDTSVYHMTDKEVALEKACDGERYLELHTDVREQQVYEG